MTHVEDRVSPFDIVTRRKRSLGLHSCAGGSPPAPSCHGAGCADCHCGNGGAHGDGSYWSDGWGVLGWRSKGSATPEVDVITETLSQRQMA